MTHGVTKSKYHELVADYHKHFEGLWTWITSNPRRENKDLEVKNATFGFKRNVVL